MESKIIKNLAMEHFLAKFREASSSQYECGIYVETLSLFLAGEISNYLQKNIVEVSTPLGNKECNIIGEEVILVPILRAGLAMLSGFQRILPVSCTGFIWAHRDENGMANIDKYKLPDVRNKTVIFLDTMLATGGTINAAVELVKEKEPKQILCASILATKIGIRNLSPLITASFAVDNSDILDEKLYVYPGVGDSGDRLFG